MAEYCNDCGSQQQLIQKNYSYIEPAFENELNYYRLVQVDSEGSWKIQKIVSVSCEKTKENNMTLYPNPAKNEISIQLKLKQNYGDGLLRIIDIMGRTCLETSIDIGKASSFKIPIDLMSGTYTVRIISDKLELPAYRLIVD